MIQEQKSMIVMQEEVQGAKEVYQVEEEAQVFVSSDFLVSLELHSCFDTFSDTD